MILGFKVGYKTDICGLSSETSGRERLNTSFKGRTQLRDAFRCFRKTSNEHN